jgi:hypothetical protein
MANASGEGQARSRRKPKEPAVPAPPEAPYELPAFVKERPNRSLVALSGEDGDAMRAELDRWYAFYRATTDIEVTLIDNMYHLATMLRRILRCEAAVQRRMAGRAELDWERFMRERVEKFKERLEIDPAAAVLGLEDSSAGAAWLIFRWQRLKGLLEKDGTWNDGDRDEAIRLQGVDPAFDRLRESEAAYLTWVYCLLSQPDPYEDAVAALLAPETRPTVLQATEITQAVLPASLCREQLHRLIARKLERLRRLEEYLWVRREASVRAMPLAHESASEQKEQAHLARYKRQTERALNGSLKTLIAACKLLGKKVPKVLPDQAI